MFLSASDPPRSRHTSLHAALPICDRRGPRRAALAIDHGAAVVALAHHVGIRDDEKRRYVRRQREAHEIEVELRKPIRHRSEEHTSELQHRCISYAVFCFKKKNTAS